jgi:hypothetical protein
MPTATYPDTTNILARITEIQEVIEPQSKAVQSPEANVDTPPYWANICRNINRVKGVIRNSEWEFTFEMLLVRAARTKMTNQGVTQTIMTDMINTLKEFGNRPDLTTDTYTSPPDNFKPDSLNIQSDGYTIIDTDEGEMVGSKYTLTFRYYVLQSIAEVDHL